MKKLLLLIAVVLILSGCPSNTSSTSYSIGNVIVSWNAVTNPTPVPINVLVGLGAPTTPGNPQTIPWPSPQTGQNWLVSDPGYSDDGYIYQWNGSTWVQQSRSLGETAVLGGIGYMYTSTGWITPATPEYYPVYYTITQTPGDYGQATAVQGEIGTTSAIFDLGPGTYSFTVSAYNYQEATTPFVTASAIPSPVSVSVGQTSYVTANLP
jgi:hypothetical protein